MPALGLALAFRMAITFRVERHFPMAAAVWKARASVAMISVMFSMPAVVARRIRRCRSRCLVGRVRGRRWCGRRGTLGILGQSDGSADRKSGGEEE